MKKEKWYQRTPLRQTEYNWEHGGHCRWVIRSQGGIVLSTGVVRATANTNAGWLRAKATAIRKCAKIRGKILQHCQKREAKLAAVVGMQLTSYEKAALSKFCTLVFLRNAKGIATATKASDI